MAGIRITEILSLNQLIPVRVKLYIIYGRKT
jgi:hypothetical protein